MDPFRTPDARKVGSATGITAVEKLASTDTLVWEGARLIVRSPREMPAWHVGKNRRTAVHFRGIRYAVVEARHENAQFDYVLDPWPERAHENPSHDISYGEHYVHEREEDARRLAIRRTAAVALLPLWPIFGWLPWPVKRVLHARFGFSPLTSTRFSVWVELALIPAGLLLLITSFGASSIMAGLFALLVDAFFRASILVDESHPPLGFGEWLVRPQMVTVARKGWSAVRARMRRDRD